MTSAAPRGGGGLGPTTNFSKLRDQSRRELAECIDKVRGAKALVLDPSLSGPLGLVAEKQLLKEHGVEKTYHLRAEPLETDQRAMVFVVRDSIVNMKAIAAQVRYDQARRHSVQYLVCLVPRRTIICERVLEEEAVYKHLVLTDLHIGLIPLEDDVLSMEIPDAYRQATGRGDKSALVDTARALRRLEALFGVIPVIKGKGALAKSVADMLLRMRREPAPATRATAGGGGEGEDAGGASVWGAGGEEEGSPRIDELILIDRCCDMVTPMLSQLTYQGLIDDLYGINNGVVELPASLLVQSSGGGGGSLAQQGGKSSKVKVYLNAADHLFAQLRDANFEQVGALVKKRATFLKSVQDEKDELLHKSVGEIKEYVRKLKEINIQQEKNLLSLHTSIALEIKKTVSGTAFTRLLQLEQGLLHGSVTSERAVEFALELMYSGAPLLKVMRVVCLTSLVTDGIKKLDALKTELVQVYGLDVIMMLYTLEEQGLLKRSEAPSGMGLTQSLSLSSSASAMGAMGVSVAQLTNKLTKNSGWEGIKKRLRLLVEEDEQSLEPLAETYSGYVPVSVRIAELALFEHASSPWLSNEDQLSIIPGAIFKHEVECSGPRATALCPPPIHASEVGKGRHVALVFFVGGVTSSEVSLLRLLARQNKADGLVRECIIGSTKLLSGDQLLASFHEPFSPNQPPQHAAKDRDSSGHAANSSTSASSSTRQTSDVRSVRST